MSEGPQDRAGRAAFGHKSAEIAVAALFFLLGALVITDSLRLGIGWQEVHGPKPGYFPFYVGLIICVSALVNAASALRARRDRDKAFVAVDQLKLVLAVLVPTAVYVALVGWIGLYEASVLFVAYFMRALGKYAWWKIGVVAFGQGVFFLAVFELWFQIPLPKGPAAEWLVAALRPASLWLRALF
ncbi:MAG: tripartite tricarboxylate transporter TctB family protein [Burkholderiales bacterium]|nr:tripartite tricarboxylate transporter TctB family protein [Burkholderiales bacterium]